MEHASISAEAISLGNHRALRAFVPIAGTDGNLADLHIAMEGAWEGHPAGPFQLSADDIDQMIARFDAQKNPMMVDYYHRSLNETGSPEDGFAAGWIQQLYRKNGPQGVELWAKVNWSPRAATAIKNGELAYCSPVIDWESVDRKSGDASGIELFNVAVTNQPFLDGQHPTRLTRVAAAFPPPKKDDKAPPDPKAQPDPNAPPADKQAASQPPAQPPPDKSAPDAEPDPGDPNEPAEQRAGEPPETKADAMPPADPNAPPTDPAMPPQQPAALIEPITTASPEQNVEDVLVGQFIDSVCKASGMDRSAVCALLNDYADSVGSAIGAKAKRDGTPAENRIMSDKQDDKTTASPASSTASKLDEIERQADKDKLVTLTERFDKLEAGVAKLIAAQESSVRESREKEVDDLIAAGKVRAERRDDAVTMMMEDAPRARRVFSETVVPVGKTQAGNDPNAQKQVATDPKTATKAELEPHEQSIYDSQRRLGRSHEKAMSFIITNRESIGRDARKIGLVH